MIVGDLVRWWEFVSQHKIVSSQSVIYLIYNPPHPGRILAACRSVVISTHSTRPVIISSRWCKWSEQLTSPHVFHLRHVIRPLACVWCLVAGTRTESRRKHYYLRAFAISSSMLLLYDVLQTGSGMRSLTTSNFNNQCGQWEFIEFDIN